MKNVISFLMPLCWILNAASLTAAGVVLTKQTPSESEAYWKPIEFGSIENYPTSVVITPNGTKQTSTITRYQIGVVIEFVDLNATSIVSEDQFNKFKAARDSLAGYASQCKQAAGILSAVVQNYDQVLRYYADGNVLIAGKWISKHDYEAKMKADQLAATAGSIPELVSGGKTFKNVRVTKVVGDRISIMHEGGIASLHASELAEEVRMKLEITFPRPFQEAPRIRTSNSPDKVVTSNNKSMGQEALPGSPPSSQAQAELNDVSSKTNSSLQPKPIPALEHGLKVSSAPLSLEHLQSIIPYLKQMDYSVPWDEYPPGFGKVIFSAKQKVYGLSLMSIGQFDKVDRIVCTVKTKKESSDIEAGEALDRFGALITIVTGDKLVWQWCVENMQSGKATKVFGSFKCSFIHGLDTSNDDAEFIVVGIEWS